MSARGGRAVPLLVAAFAAATTSALLPATPAAAAGCATADGVTVVVDFHELGGGVQTACVTDGGGDRASDLFPAAGFALDYVQRQPGFVCRVAGKPADNPCVEHAARRRLLGPVVVRREVRQVELRHHERGRADASPTAATSRSPGTARTQSAPPGTSPAVRTRTDADRRRRSRRQQPTKQPTKQSTKQPGGSASHREQPGRPPASSAADSAAPAVGRGAHATEPARRRGRSSRSR